MVTILQIVVALIEQIEVLPVVLREEKHKGLIGYRKREELHIIHLLGQRNRLLCILQRLIRVLDIQQIGHIQIGGHRKLRITIAHLLQGLQIILLSLRTVIARTIDIAKEASGQIVIVGIAIPPYHFVQLLGCLHGFVDMAMAHIIEALVALDLVVIHKTVVVKEVLLIIIGQLVELLFRALLIKFTELVEHLQHFLFLRRICRGGTGIYQPYCS